MANRFGALSCALLLALTAAPAFACRCVPLTIAGAYRGAELVITGTVLKVDGIFDGPGGAVATLSTEQSWKGETLAQFEVSTQGTCAFNFEMGHKYLVFIRKTSGISGMTTNKCIGNRAIENANAELSWLRKNIRRNKIHSATTGSKLESD